MVQGFLHGQRAGGSSLLLSVLIFWWMLGVFGSPAYPIDVKLTMDEAKEALTAGREPMLKANSVEKVREIVQRASKATRVGADPETDPCGTSAILRTKRFWLESFGRKEATESKRQKKEIRMPDNKIRKYLEMPNLEIEVQLCGDDEYFAEGAQVTLLQGSKRVQPVDVSPAERGRKNPGKGPAYRSRFTARFSYDSFDPSAKTKVEVFFLDGRLDILEADFSKIK
ncbi:MAG: hypothetical protein ACE5MM_05755 [Nitrospiraceae bacterium]